MARRWIGAALALAGLLTLLLLFASNAPPTPYEAWVSEGSARGHLLVARGPAEARYDADADATRAVFWCGHARCPFAASLDGDQLAAVDEESVVLYAPIVPPPRETETIAPVAVDGGNVTNATLARFEPGAAWFTLSLYQGAFALLALGVSAAAGASGTRVFAEGVGLGAGLVAGTFLAPFTGALILPVFTAVLVGAGAAITAVGARWWPRLGNVAAALVAAFVALLFSFVVTADFFAHPSVV